MKEQLNEGRYEPHCPNFMGEISQQHAKGMQHATYHVISPMPFLVTDRLTQAHIDRQRDTHTHTNTEGNTVLRLPIIGDNPEKSKLRYTPVSTFINLVRGVRAI